QAARERQTLLLVDGNLRDAVKLILHGVFNRDDLVFLVANLVQGGVKRRRLARPGGACDEDHAVRLGDVATEVAQVAREEADNVEREVSELLVDLLLVEDTYDRVLAVD